MDRILDILKAGRNLILSAPTATGKSTQVPKAILRSGLLGEHGKLIVVQPRRIAAISLARRVAYELSEPVGGLVGCIVRKERRVSPSTRICFVTDGVLIRMIEKDRRLSGVGCVIFDEVHERKLLSDLGLAVLRKEQMTHSKLRLVAMSATQDADRFAAYLEAETVQLKQAAFPVDIRHVQRAIRFDGMPNAIAKHILELHGSDRDGDILAFLPGKREILEVMSLLEKKRKKDAAFTVRILHGSLERGEQDLAFAPVRGRKIILATNIAETSLTVPGVSMVVDSGYERRSSFDPETGAMRLETHPISRSSAVQRTGRASRERPGVCVRLWPESMHGKLEQRPHPEIQRADVAGMLMTLKSIGFNNPQEVEFIDGPADEQIAAGEKLLHDLGATDAAKALTPIGWRMLRLPLAPRYARMVVEAERLRCLQEVAAIATVMAGEDIKKYPTQAKQKAAAKEAWDSLHRNSTSDFFTLLHIYTLAMDAKFDRGWCRDLFLNRDALREAHDLRKKIVGVCVRRGSKWNKQRASEAAILRCIAVGFPDRVAERLSPGRFKLMNGDVVRLESSSVVSTPLVICGRLRLFAGVDKDGGIGKVSLLTRADQHMLHQALPHLFRQRLRVAAYSYDAGAGKLTDEVLFGDLVLSSTERLASHVELGRIELDLSAKAETDGLNRLIVEQAKKGRTVIRLDGKEFPVAAEPGVYWGRIVWDGAGVRFHLLWRHFGIPIVMEKAPHQLEKLRTLSSSVEKILLS